MYKSSKQAFYPYTYLLLPGGFDPRHSLSNSLCHRRSPLLAGRPTRIGASGPRLQGRSVLAQPATVQPLDQSQEDPLPRVPRQQAVDQPSPTSHDLAGHLDHRRTERRELHPQQQSFLGLVFGRMPGRYRCHQGTPSLQAPGQTGHHHVGPVAHQIVHRRRQRVYAAFELGDQVLLVAAIVGREHDLVGRGHAVVRDIEEVAILLEQPHLPFVRPQKLAQDDHPITLVAGDGAILELGDHLLEYVDRLEPTLFDDLLLDPFGLLAGCGLDLIPRGSFQEAVLLGRESVGQFLEIVRRGHAEDELDVAGAVPAIEVGTLSEFGIAPQAVSYTHLTLPTNR